MVREVRKRRELPTAAWSRRHGGIVVALWAHALVLAVAATLLRGTHGAAEAALVLAAAFIAAQPRLSRSIRETAATLGILLSSAVLVHLGNGAIEMHFHFFVGLALISLYQRWLPFVLAVGFILVHHGLGGLVAPESVYNHAPAWQEPLKWAAIHAVFVLGAAIANLLTWSSTEDAFIDSLTGLVNRKLFLDRLGHGLVISARSAAPVAVIFFDLDDFKSINDTQGHGAGDELLALVGARLRTQVREADTVARLGGDEFAIIVRDAVTDASVEEVARRVLRVLAEPVTIGADEILLAASIGIAVSEPGDSAEDLLRNADLAMYQAKAAGKGAYRFFRPAMHADLVSKLNMTKELRRALVDGEFVLHFQPTVNLATHRVEGLEALVRWQPPSGPLRMPSDFIGLAESTGLIVPLGRWVLEEACRQMVGWQQAFPSGGGSPKLSVAVNLSARQIVNPRLEADVAAVLDATGLDPASLVLEITETVLMQDTALSIDQLNRLKGLGVRLALDDFGTGYSSLSYLKRFPIDVLKIDKSFVDGLAHGAEASTLARAVIRLGHTLGMQTVAEGVETAEQAASLAALRCDTAQGYYFARPIPAPDIDRVIARARAGCAWSVAVATPQPHRVLVRSLPA